LGHRASSIGAIGSGLRNWAQLAKKFDAYAGLMYSQVNAGRANGYLHQGTVDPTAGPRFKF
jgi:hypothetical protein